MQYAELKVKTNYSFLEGASHPDELVHQAAKIGLFAISITDRDGVYGAPKAYMAQQSHPDLKLLIGSEVTFRDHPRVTFIAKNRRGYGLLCRICTAAHAGSEKGKPELDWNEFVCLIQEYSGAVTGLVVLPEMRMDTKYSFLKDVFQQQLYFPLARLLNESDEGRYEFALRTSKRWNTPIVANNEVVYHHPSRRKIYDVMIATHENQPLSKIGKKVFSNSERYLKTAEEMARLFRDKPSAIENTLEIAESCQFKMSELRYYYPSEWIPVGHTAQSYLSEEVWKGAQERYRGKIPDKVRAQLEHELKLVSELKFADYFLTIWDIVEYARKNQILCQGRGSAANSIICYCLGITAVDPVRMNLLFERFISAERGEPPDIDVDFEHERREEVIQYIYQKYGRDRAAMVSAVITYRTRSAIRDVGKALGIAEKSEIPEDLIEEIKGFPRHLSIHSGGFTLSADPIVEIVPVEPARMEGRTIVQWDKYDLDILGLLKVDVLALGMLSAIRKCLTYIDRSLVQIPAEDRQTYQMIQKADTIGTFQIESRAQMGMLGRLRPRNFYDLVIQVAIVRPGPIVGKMVHPYLKRRRGWEKIDMPHPKLKPILAKTLGVPLFQEQVMKMAIVLGDFSPGEADQLRRAIGAWRSSGSIHKVGAKLKAGFLRNGLPEEFVDRVFEQIKGFAHYGFPESHAASFALLAYASSYLKCHHPTEFCCAMLNSQPLGFYSNHTLIDDAKRHGVKIRPLDVNRSEWDCTLEEGEMRLGLRVVRGLPKKEGERLIVARKDRPFSSLQDFLARAAVRKDALQTLALGDAFAHFGQDQRHTLWAIIEHEASHRPLPNGQLNLFTYLASIRQSEVFSQMTDLEAIQSDYRSYGLSLRGHPMQAIRPRVAGLPKLPVAALKRQGHGKTIQAAGLAIVRQHPSTAKGVVFMTLEDETGFLDLILHQKVFEKYRPVIMSHAFLVVRGELQIDGHSVSVLAKRFSPVWQPLSDDRQEGLTLHPKYHQYGRGI